jgi:acylglycerol lipase
MRSPLAPPVLQRWTMSDGCALHGRVWLPTRSERPHAIIYLHGIQSHGGWFEWSASLLAEHGYAVVLADRRGSGLSGGERGDAPSARRWLVDIDELAAWISAELGAERLNLVGVSWGGKLAIAWALRHADRIRRVLLIGPGLFPVMDVGLRARFGIAQSLLTGGKRPFAIPLNDPELFTDNPAGQDFIANDPLRLTHATARFFWHSRQLDRQLLRTADGVLQAQTTLVLAGRDRIIRNGLTEVWVRRVAGDDAQVVKFAEAAHTLEFAADQGEYRTLLERWAEERFCEAAEKNCNGNL